MKREKEERIKDKAYDSSIGVKEGSGVIDRFSQKQQKKKDRTDRIERERAQRYIHLAALHGPLNKPHDAVENPSPDIVNRQGDQQFDDDPYGLAHQVVEDLLHVEVRKFLHRLDEIRLLDAVRHDQRGRSLRRKKIQ